MVQLIHGMEKATGGNVKGRKAKSGTSLSTPAQACRAVQKKSGGKEANGFCPSEGGGEGEGPRRDGLAIMFLYVSSKEGKEFRPEEMLEWGGRNFLLRLNPIKNRWGFKTS